MNNSTKPLAICLMGPTASGKTDLAVNLVASFNCEIISVDSALIYRGMDIGTAKPDASILSVAPHRLIDIRDPAEVYSVAQFREDALKEMAEITSRGKTPLLVGGTMMYFKALCQGIASMPKANDELRQQILSQAEQDGWQAMHERLTVLDPAAAEKIHPNNRQRILRALEVCMLSGKKMSDLWAGASWETGQNADGDYTKWDEVSFDGLPYSIVNLAIAPAARQTLHDRIGQRFQQMLANGFIEEVAGLRQRADLHSELPSIRSVGYRQVWEYLSGGYSRDEMIEKGTAATRQLAKRQLTWLRSWPDVNWLESEDSELITKTLAILAAKA
ncbi:MAG: tRNA (adenosine(37)-N6)-dimethylallyltransferase MiaA [Hahellaceae bacterium]|nr:tRNA (adenosine(37)-N6)-dimethylallyltransferase MiaA [Hahellaceae bacterium]MCP5211153.1 tRNA (adenosine(37)-N6)-dimethylallyltransferase MiaA [Hahellaceae bacterium]